MVNDITSPFRLDEVRGVVAGRGSIVGSVDDLRGDFSEALLRTLCDGERPELLLAIRGDRVLRRDVPAVVLALTDRALLVLREAQRTGAGPALGVRAAILSYRGIVSLELGHSALRGTLGFGLIPATRLIASLIVADIRGGTVMIPYHTLDEPAIAAFLHRLRELAKI